MAVRYFAADFPFNPGAPHTPSANSQVPASASSQGTPAILKIRPTTSIARSLVIPPRLATSLARSNSPATPQAPASSLK